MKKWTVVVMLAATACGARETALRLDDLPPVDAARLLEDIAVLASDEYGGRAPGSPGEQLTVNYLIERFAAAGAEPGAPGGGWTQAVPLVGITPVNVGSLVVGRNDGTQTRAFRPHDEVIAFSQRVAPRVAVDDSPLVFAGYGVQAPEFDWDDFRGVDVAGKTLIVLVNDPPVRVEGTTSSALDPNVFGGDAMTYYGRWSYKYEKAAELGAAGIFVVHETDPAGYPFSVAQGFGGERFDLVTPDRNMTRAAVQGWLSHEAAVTLLRMGGFDFHALKAAARTRDFQAVDLGMRASISFSQSLRQIESRNVIARIAGADPATRNECVVYTAHWDHLGSGTAVNGDHIYNGARDNASGTAMLLEIARAFRSVRPPPRRTILFVATTAEEQGLLGSEHYVRSPACPLEDTLAAINIDALNIWGRTHDLTIIGLGTSDLDAFVRRAAAEQGRRVGGDRAPGQGHYYRSDHFSFAKAGVPALHTEAGIMLRNQPAAFARDQRDAWMSRDYHRPTDELMPWWDLSGAAEDGQLLLAVGYRVANADRFPEWAAGSEFRAARERSRRP